MKTIIAVLLIGTLVLFFACSKGEGKGIAHTTEVVVMYDKTDPLLSTPNESINSLFDIGSNTTRGAIFRLVEISDIDYNQTVQIEVKPQSLLMQNPGARKAEITSFFSQVDDSITNLQDQPAEKPRSDIYANVAREVNQLALQNVDTKIACVYSDLQENTDIFSTYRASDVAMLYQNPQAVEALFEQERPLGNLTGVQINILYRARGYEDAKLFGALSNLYKTIFESHGATVSISANL